MTDEKNKICGESGQTDAHREAHEARIRREAQEVQRRDDRASQTECRWPFLNPAKVSRLPLHFGAWLTSRLKRVPRGAKSKPEDATIGGQSAGGAISLRASKISLLPAVPLQRRARHQSSPIVSAIQKIKDRSELTPGGGHTPEGVLL